ncbi:hypothetical protein JCM8097_003995 [Rhodosporidiobolus ruineniae]
MSSAALGAAASADASWITPYYAALLEKVLAGESPYLYIVEVVEKLYHPTVPWGFRTQLGVVNGLFGIANIVVLLGLLVRILTGRFWLFHRLDRTVILPNTSTIYGVCSMAYTAVGMVVVVCAVRVSKDVSIPRYYVGARAAWIGPLWTGIFCECWSTICAWYIRKKGAFYKESWGKTVIAVVLPILLPLAAWIPPTTFFYLSSHNFNTSYRICTGIVGMLTAWQADWTPEKGFEVDKLTQLIEPGAALGRHLVAYSTQSRIGYAYCTVVLVLTCGVYIVGSSLEISHLASTIAQLRGQAVTRANQPQSPFSSTEFSTPKSSSFSTRLRQVVSPSSIDLPHPPHPRRALMGDLINDESFPSPSASDVETVQPSWTLLAWARRNRIYSAICIAAMLLINAALELWQALTPLDLRYPSGQWQVEILVSCWLNGILTTLVALLLLFRSLDSASSPLLARLRTALPFLPFPPPVSPAAKSLITTEPPRFAVYGGGSMPLLERMGTLTIQEGEDEDEGRRVGSSREEVGQQGRHAGSHLTQL